ncbi:uncharacterized protein LOC142974124 isoform X2 [Anticarsia gemmatalis]|uniref:uncharacterized protein LOC142974124 isoform X2 n=1 Tax=Anticarsia gemmatalis TaxID=129554 RepID=UPI003F7641D1
MELMTQEDSYADRRQLFKNIWDTAMQINEKDVDIMNKTKVIKTLRLDQVDKCVVGRKKKERIKNLRTVCNKILDFCDRQDADDKFYEQEQRKIPEAIEGKPKKIKLHRRKKKIRRAKSLMSSKLKKAGITIPEVDTASEENETSDFINALRQTSTRLPARYSRALTVETALTSYKPSSIDKARTDPIPDKTSATRRVRKRRSRRKKRSDVDLGPNSPGTSLGTSKVVNASARGRAVIKRVRELLAVHKVLIA